MDPLVAVVGLQAYARVLKFYMSAEDLNLGFCAYTASTLSVNLIC